MESNTSTDTSIQAATEPATQQDGQKPDYSAMLQGIPAEELAKLIAPEIDRRVNRVSKELQEYKSKYTATLNEDQRKQAEFEEQRRLFENERQEFERQKTETAVLEIIADRKLSTAFKPFLYDTDPAGIVRKADSLQSIINEAVKAQVEAKIKEAGYVPTAGTVTSASLITAESLSKLTPAEISKLRAEGKLDHLMK